MREPFIQSLLCIRLGTEQKRERCGEDAGSETRVDEDLVCQTSSLSGEWRFRTECRGCALLLTTEAQAS